MCFIYAQVNLSLDESAFGYDDSSIVREATT